MIKVVMILISVSRFERNSYSLLHIYVYMYVYVYVYTVYLLKKIEISDAHLKAGHFVYLPNI